MQGVIRVIDYRDAWKLQPGIIERLGTHQQPSRRELDEMGLLGLIVSLHPGEDLETSIAAIRETGATVERVERVGTHDELSIITLPQNLEFPAPTLTADQTIVWCLPGMCSHVIFKIA